MNYLSAAEELLGATSAQRGLGAMEHTAALKGPNAFDSGAASKVQFTQPYNNSRYDEQNKTQNLGSALPQAQSSQVQALRKQRLIKITRSKTNALAEDVKVK